MILKQAMIQINEAEVQFAFGMSKMSVTNEPSNYVQYKIMQFVEFLEFIGRLADAKYKDNGQPLC